MEKNTVRHKQQTDSRTTWPSMPRKSELPKGSVLTVAARMHGHGQFVGA
jgi:hypothetical protein